MSDVYVASIAEAQAIGLCWMARQPGLPEIDMLRRAVVQMHPEPCGWCEYDLPHLLAMLQGYSPQRRAENDWWALPGKARLEAIRIAQGRQS